MANNVSGENGAGHFDGFGGQSSAYGEVKKLQTAQKLVPIGSAPGITAPKQATRHSQKPQTPSAPPPSVAVAQPDAHAWHAQAWAALAADPGASDLVRQLAAEYTGQFG